MLAAKFKISAIKRLFCYPLRYFSHSFVFKRWQFNSIVIVSALFGAVSGLYLTSIFVHKIIATGQRTETWTFTNPNEFVASDNSQVGFSGSSAILLSQEYVSDNNTVGLYHFNGSSNDQSALSNNGIGDSISFLRHITKGKVNQLYASNVTREIAIKPTRNSAKEG